MSDKELLEYLEKYIEVTEKNNKDNKMDVGIEISVDMAKQLLSIIQKQQKEIEKLEKILNKYEHELASEESAINLYAEIRDIAKGESDEYK